MELSRDRVAGLDVPEKAVVVSMRTPGDVRARRSETREFETFIADLEQLRHWLTSEGVTHVAIEPTGVFWKLRFHLAHIDHLDATIANTDNQIDRKHVPFDEARRQLMTITGVGKTTAEVLIADIGSLVTLPCERRRVHRGGARFS